MRKTRTPLTAIGRSPLLGLVRWRLLGRHAHEVVRRRPGFIRYPWSFVSVVERVTFYGRGSDMARVWRLPAARLSYAAHRRQARKANRRAELAARRREAAYIAAHGFGL